MPDKGGDDTMPLLFLQAVAAFLILPGTVGFLFPLLLSPRHSSASPLHWIGAPVLGLGIFILLWCVRDFYVSGKGTLAPWSPPRNLVKEGLYRFSRNPMYVGVATILIGWTIWFMTGTLLIYTVAIVIMFHLRVVLGEEPFLARTHGQAWKTYKEEVPRWFL